MCETMCESFGQEREVDMHTQNKTTKSQKNETADRLEYIKFFLDRLRIRSRV